MPESRRHCRFSLPFPPACPTTGQDPPEHGHGPLDTLFFIASKVFRSLIRADVWLLIAAAATTLALLRNRPRAARRWSIGLLAYILVLGLLPVGELVMRPLETRYPPNPPLPAIDGIVVLGGGEDTTRTIYWDQPQVNDAGERFTAAIALARQIPDVPVLFTGGDGQLTGLLSDRPGGAIVAEKLFADLGLPTDRVQLEGLSRNTAENARFSYDLIQPTPDQTWVLVTSAFHMPRAMRSFDAAGWPGMIAWPVDFRTGAGTGEFGWFFLGQMGNINTALKEYVGLVAYGLTGR